MTLMERPNELVKDSQLFVVEGEPDACDVYVREGEVVWIVHVSRIVMSYGHLHSLTALDWLPEKDDAARESFGMPMTAMSRRHLDWYSGSSMESFERAARGYFEGRKSNRKNSTIGFDRIIQLAAARLQEFILQTGDLEEPTEVEYTARMESEYLIYPVWPKSNRPVVWFGQGETGKGMMSVAAAFCLCYGEKLAGLHVKSQGRGGVYVDYEDEYSELNWRHNRIARGMDMVIAPNLRRFDPKSRLFVDIVESLKAKVEAMGGTDFYVIDSAIPACGGDVLKPEPVGAFFRAVQFLDKPVLIIAHETKETRESDSAASPFGSQLWRTAPAMNVNFQGSSEPRQEQDGRWARDILLRCTKANNVPRFQPLAFQLVFSEDPKPGQPRALQTGPAATWIRQISPTTVSVDLQEKLPPLQRMVAALKGRELTVTEMAETTGMPRKTIDTYARRHSGLFVITGGGRGKDATPVRLRLIEGGQS